MDDKDQDQAATDTGIGTAGSTLGGAAAGAVAGTALGVPVVGTVIGALSGPQLAQQESGLHGRRRRSLLAKKEELNDEETIDKTESKVDERPQSFQKNRSQKDGKSSGKKANAESRTSIEAACDRQKGRAKVEQVTLALERTG